MNDFGEDTMRSDTVNILLVDDHPENLLSLEGILEPLSANLVRAGSGEEALRLLLEQDFALILLDVQMPGMDGFETASLIRKRRRSRQTPIIFLTAFSTSSEMLSRGYSLGAVDYLHKPIDPVILLSKATVFVDLFRKTQEIQQQSVALEQQANQLAAANIQLRQSEEQFRLLSEGSPIGIFLTDAQGNLTYTNPRFAEICGFAAPATLQVDLLQAISPDDRTRMQSAWSIYLENNQEDDREFSDEFQLLPSDSLLASDNQLPSDNSLASQDQSIDSALLRWVHVRSRPLFSAQHDLLGHLGTIEDITERKQAEVLQAQMIREQIARHEAEATNRMKDEFLAVLSHELRTPLNAMMGWAKILSDSFTRQNSRRLDESTVTRGLSIIQRNAQAQTQLIEDLLDVSRIIQGKIVLNAAPVCLSPIVEAAIESVRPQAHTKNIQLTAQFAAQEVTTVQGDAVRLQQVIWNLLTNAIKFTPEGGRVEVRVGEWGSGGVGEQGGRGAGEQGSGRVGEWESGRVGEWESQPSSPDLTDTSSLPSSSYPPIPSSSYPPIPPSPHPSKYVQLTVTDTGIGIAPEFLPHVFDRFQQEDSTTTRSYTGLGLGLAIVRYLVELHGGTVCAESRGQGQGSTFTVYLPQLSGRSDEEQGSRGAEEQRSKAAGEQGSRGAGEPLTPSSPYPPIPPSPHPPIPPSPHPPIPLPAHKILLVDDEADSREMLSFVLEEHGMTVTAAEGAAQALAALAKDRFDLLISDISMPDVDGYDLLQQVRSLAENPNVAVPAIALTAHASAADRQRALAVGFQTHLAKPIEPEILLRAIEALVNPTMQNPVQNRAVDTR